MSRKPSAGPGWGGPAKGAHPDKPIVPISVAQAARLAMNEAEKEARRAAKAANDAKAQELKDHLALLATTAERQDTQVRAAEAWLDRHEGKPVTRNINVDAGADSALKILADDPVEAANIYARLMAGD